MQEEQEDFKGKERRQEEGVSISMSFLSVIHQYEGLRNSNFNGILISYFIFVLLDRADPFAKKDWYDIKAPSVFQVKNVGKTLVTRTQGTKV